MFEKPKFTDSPVCGIQWMNPPSGHFVYIIESAAGLVKVGIAGNLEKRLRSLQTGSPHKLRLVDAFFLPDKKFAKTVENQAHERFSFSRAEGEWFRVAPDIAMIGISLEIRSLPKPIGS